MTSHQSDPSLSDSGFISPTTSALLQLQKAAERGKYTAADWAAYEVYLDAIDKELDAGNRAEAVRLSKLAEQLGFESRKVRLSLDMCPLRLIKSVDNKC